ncbi:hypothetical protein HDU99_008587, partial [Rhizoclosmatium hyalinum]
LVQLEYEFHDCHTQTVLSALSRNVANKRLNVHDSRHDSRNESEAFLLDEMDVAIPQAPKETLEVSLADELSASLRPSNSSNDVVRAMENLLAEINATKSQLERINDTDQLARAHQSREIEMLEQKLSESFCESVRMKSQIEHLRAEITDLTQRSKRYFEQYELEVAARKHIHSDYVEFKSRSDCIETALQKEIVVLLLQMNQVENDAKSQQ